MILGFKVTKCCYKAAILLIVISVLCGSEARSFPVVAVAKPWRTGHPPGIKIKGTEPFKRLLVHPHRGRMHPPPSLASADGSQLQPQSLLLPCSNTGPGLQSVQPLPAMYSNLFSGDISTRPYNPSSGAPFWTPVPVYPYAYNTQQQQPCIFGYQPGSPTNPPLPPPPPPFAYESDVASTASYLESFFEFLSILVDAFPDSETTYGDDEVYIYYDESEEDSSVDGYAGSESDSSSFESSSFGESNNSGSDSDYDYKGLKSRMKEGPAVQ